MSADADGFDEGDLAAHHGILTCFTHTDDVADLSTWAFGFDHFWDALPVVFDENRDSRTRTHLEKADDVLGFLDLGAALPIRKSFGDPCDLLNVHACFADFDVDDFGGFRLSAVGDVRQLDVMKLCASGAKQSKRETQREFKGSHMGGEFKEACHKKPEGEKAPERFSLFKNKKPELGEPVRAEY